MNNSNLVNLKNRSKEERKEIARKGARASAEVKRNKATLKEMVEDLLAKPLTKEETTELEAYGLNKEDLNNMAYMIAKLIEKAKNGDVKAVEKVIEIAENDNNSKQFEKNLEYRYKELELKEKELDLRKQLKLESSDDIANGVVIVEVGKGATETDIHKAIKSKGLEGVGTVIINDIPNE